MKSRPRVLIVEDDETAGRLYREVLGSIADADVVGTCAQAIETLGTMDVDDVVVADQHLPDGNGLSVLMRAKERNIGGLILTGDPNSKLATEANRDGWVVLTKPIPNDYLRVFVEHLLSVGSLRAVAR